MAGKIKEIKAAEFEKEVLQKERVVLDFYSTECPPCEALASKYESLSNIYGDDIQFVKIFRQENRELAAELDVSGSPTVIFFQNGERVGKTLSGVITSYSIHYTKLYERDEPELCKAAEHHVCHAEGDTRLR